MAGSELRRRTGFVALSLSAVLITSLVVAIPPIFIPEASAAATQAPAIQPQPPIPQGDRLPVPAYPQENTVLHPAEVLPVDLPDDVPPGQVPEGLTPLPERGGPNFDVFGVGSKARPHVATVFPSVVNFQAGNGRWEDLPTQFVPDPSGGWRAEPLRASLRFPGQLSLDDPVQITFPGGTVRIAPSGAGGAGTSDGPTITYADALGATDFVYRLQGGGYKEEVVLKDPSASGIISYQLTAPGFDLAATSGGEVELSRAGGVVATLSVPVAYDSSAPVASAVPSVDLEDLGSGDWRITVTVDPSFLAAATYPITIDPTFTTYIYETASGVHDDTYVDLANPGSSFADASWLSVSGSASATRNGFQYFDTSAFERAGIVVYNDTEVTTMFSGGGNGTIDVRRVTDPWSSPMTWNNQPASGELIDTFTSSIWQGWWEWDVAPLYQHYLDTRPIYSWPNHGMRISSPTAGLTTFFASGEHGLWGPYMKLTLVYNNLPGPPVLDVPADGFVSENDTPTLKVKAGPDWPTDPDGESVMVQVQVSDDPNLFTGSHLKWQSGFSDERSFLVPSGVLVDGNTYYWRAQSWDVCVEPALMCATNNVELNSTASRSIQIALKHYGDDPRYSMWSHDAGNGMTIKVNEANGNLFLDVPFDSLATAIGDLSFGINYNSQENVDYGLTGGWSLDIGPSSSRRDVPLELVKLQPFPDAGVKIRLKGNRPIYFPHRDRKVFASVGPGTGVVKQNADDTFLWTTASGGQYEFNAGGKLLRADPVASAAAHGDFGFDYAYNGQGELQSVTDPLGRAVTINWVNNRPDTLSTWTGETWTFNYTGGRLSSVSVNVTNPSTGLNQLEKVAFEYNGAGNISEVDNGVTKANDRTGWLVTYATDPKGLRRVSTVTAPPGGGAPSTPTPWSFEYYGPYIGTTATYACVTDPLGTPGGASCNAGHQTKVDFNTSGLPIGITGPADQTGYLPVTTMIWDSNNNIVCRRTPAANAALLIQWNPAQPNACINDARSTKFNYRNDAPFQLLSERNPAPTSGGTGNRRLTTYDYDRDTAGANFNGLWAELFENKDLRGVPKDSLVWGDMDESWGAGAPPGLNSTDNFSIRWTGMLDVTDFPSGSNPGKRVNFRLYTTDEGGSLVVGNSVLLDCLGTTQPPGTYNCGENQDVSKKLLPGLRPITIEYAEVSGNASFRLEWDQSDSWTVIPAWRLQSNLGLLTKQTLSFVSGTTTTDVLETKYHFDTDWAKARQLPNEVSAKDLATSENRRSTFTYNQYGQVLTTTTAAGTTQAATTTNVYTNNATTSCLSQVTDPTGAITTFTCNGAGDVT